MARSLAVLISKGLVTKDEHPTDGRQAIVRITAAGRWAIAQGRSVVDEWYVATLQALSVEDRAALQAAGPALRRLAAEAMEWARNSSSARPQGDAAQGWRRD
jgi:DNA-binding MarR family transcriptional regulator